jgi:L-fucose mutarotase/ribose pyranase (RbsD/FucU family)
VLIGIDPLLGPACLALLRAMGHGDQVVLGDANFPATTTGRRVVRLDRVAAGAEGERRFYGNLIVRKGVIAPPASGDDR